ncbi:MAG: hypothetical protein NC548_29065 [Lachnospiraceae bacterium]|nr:hypothetical protein [Lachnospiraceae bacterium]
MGLAMVGCNNEIDPVVDRIWCGDLCRAADGERLSEVCMELSGDTLRVYSNAIFGADNECLLCRMNQQSDRLFVDAGGGEFPMKFTYSADEETPETLLVEGPDYRMLLHPAAEAEFTPELLAFYKHRSVPSQASLYFSGRWTGDIVRLRDGQQLSKVCAEYETDTLYIYANAIFGKANEVLLYNGYSDGKFVYTNLSGEEIILAPVRQDEKIVMKGADFSMTVLPFDGDWQAARKFYKRLNVPRSADSYMFGRYSGRAKGRVPLGNALSGMSGLSPEFMNVQCSVTLEFLDVNQCRYLIECQWTDPQMVMMMAMAGQNARFNTSKTHTYRVEGNRIILDKKGGTFYIQTDGSLLLPSESDPTVELDDLILRRQ